MFVGHLPAGYLVTQAILARTHTPSALRRRLLWLGLAASVLPDLDLLWFYLVDARRHVHHSYVPHLPGFWLLVLAAVAAVLALRRANRAAWLALAVFGTNVLGHLLLDTVAAAFVGCGRRRMRSLCWSSSSHVTSRGTSISFCTGRSRSSWRSWAPQRGSGGTVTPERAASSPARDDALACAVNGV